MHKWILLLTAVLVFALGAAVLFRSDLQRERARADALAARVAVLEPVERSEGSPSGDSTPNIRPASPAPAAERAVEPPTSSGGAEQPSPPKREFRGSRDARRQVEGLQAALAGGTPLQDYQIQALMGAIDEVRAEIESEQKTAGRPATSSNVDWNAESRERLIQAADDILFESQLEVFIELLTR